METATSSFSYSLEITIMSAESLTNASKKPVRKNLFVTISPDDQAYYFKQQRTKVCQDDGNCFPAWNDKLTMDMPMHVKFIVLEVRCTTRSGDKSIGVAKVPVADFVGNPSTPQNYLHFLSYRLRDTYGEPNGILNFSVKIVKGLDSQCGRHNHNYNYGYMGSAETKGYSYGNNKENCVPKPCQRTHEVVGHPRNSSAAVVGVPAWYNSTHL